MKNWENFSPKSVPGEGGIGKYVFGQTDQFTLAKVIEEKILSFDEASRCLSTLGKDESGSRYAYLMMTVTDRYLSVKKNHFEETTDTDFQNEF